jgi:hypothetical protein
VLVFASLLVWAAAQYLRLAWGNFAALCGVVILALMPSLLVWSVAVVIGLPAIALAAAALLALAYWSRARRPAWLAVSGALFGLSLLTKLFTGFLAPVFIGGLLVEAALRRPRSWLRLGGPAMLWTAACGVTLLGAAALLLRPWQVSAAGQAEFLRQLIQPHFGAAGLATAALPEEAQTINTYLAGSLPALGLALLGAGLGVARRRWLMLYPAAWVGLAYLALLNYRPVWGHHQALVTVPAALLAGVATAEALGGAARWAASWRPRWEAQPAGSPPAGAGALAVTAVGLLLLAWTLAQLAPPALTLFASGQVPDSPRLSSEERFMKKIAVYAPQTRWMATDLAMYAFRAGLPVPPELAVISWKRLAVGGLSDAALLEILQQRQPEQVLLGRFEFPGIEPYLAEKYVLVLERGEARQRVRLFVRRDLLR